MRQTNEGWLAIMGGVRKSLISERVHTRVAKSAIHFATIARPDSLTQQLMLAAFWIVAGRKQKPACTV
jgi:hypothetical protein